MAGTLVDLALVLLADAPYNVESRQAEVASGDDLEASINIIEIELKPCQSTMIYVLEETPGEQLQ